MYIPKSLNTCLHNYISEVRRVSEKIRINVIINKEIYNKLLKHIYEKKTQGQKINISKAVEQAIMQYLSKGEQNE